MRLLASAFFQIWKRSKQNTDGMSTTDSVFCLAQVLSESIMIQLFN